MSCVKLFGWTIPSASHDQILPSSALPDSFDHGKENHSLSCSLSLQPHMDMMNNESITSNSEQNHTSLNKESKETSENSDEQHSEITTTTTTSEEKTTDLKKPDKILPCPRCNSQDTKFCYYNNYNVNQPRHFCRNCQRYWTSGGTMRMVPVGSGRRKHKTWVSSDHITNNHNTSSTKILSFESCDSLEHHPSNNSIRGFLPTQVTSSVSQPWPYQYSSFNPSFYNMPVYWGVTVPVWSTLETSTCLGKRTRDEEDSHGSDKESKDNFLRARFAPETYLNLQANPAAMARSINFMESM